MGPRGASAGVTAVPGDAREGGGGGGGGVLKPANKEGIETALFCGGDAAVGPVLLCDNRDEADCEGAASLLMMPGDALLPLLGCAESAAASSDWNRMGVMW